MGRAKPSAFTSGAMGRAKRSVFTSGAMGRSGDDRNLSAPVFQRSTPHEQVCPLNELANGLPNHPHVRADTEL